MSKAILSRASSVAALLVLESAGIGLAAGTFTVSTNGNAGVGTLRQALLDANAAGGGTINFAIGTNTITLASPLPVLATPLTINGNGASVSGGSLYRVFFSDAPTGSTTTISDLAIRDGRAIGGYGGYGGGGGGLGAGGGLFVARASVVLSNVAFTNNFVVGGHGGNALNYTTGAQHSGGGGGGLGGDGAIAGTPNFFNGGVGGGGGGLYGSATGNNGGGSDFFSAGTEGGGPLSAAMRYGGGYGASTSGGDGGPFGGGGGGSIQAGRGGFGGGGGSGGASSTSTLDGHGGDGGFGGGGGGSGGLYTAASSLNPGRSGAFAGATLLPDTGSPEKFYQSEVGAGGAALGANVFATPFANVTFNDTLADEGSLIGGPGGHAYLSALVAGTGNTSGSNLFLTGQTRINVSSGQSRRFAGAIDDVADYINDPTAFGYDYVSIIKGGAGDLTLSGNSDYRGGTVISQGTLNAGTSNSLGSGTVTLNDANTGSANTRLVVGTEIAAVSLYSPIVVATSSGTATIASAPTNAGAAYFVGAVKLNGSVTLLGQNSTTLDAADSVGQTVFFGAITGAGGVTVSGGHMVQFRGTNTYAGPTLITANSTLSIYNATSSSPNSRVTIDAGSTLTLEGVATAILSLDGAGSVNTNNGTTTLLAGATDNLVHTFSGTFSNTTYTLQLNKAGTDTLILGPQTNRRLNLGVTGGLLKAGGDLHPYELDLDKSAAGRQAFDLNGHLLDVTQVTIPPTLVGDALNAAVGTSSDGIFDSTNVDSRKAIGVAKIAATNLYTVKTTWKGDANLDGKVNFDDLVPLAQNYNKSVNLDWSKGDFNRDGLVNFDDLIPLAQNYNIVGTPLTLPENFSSTFASDWALAQSLVPEPTAPCAAVLATFVARARRRLPDRR